MSGADELHTAFGDGARGLGFELGPDFVEEAGSDGQELALPEQPDTDAAMPTIVEAGGNRRLLACWNVLEHQIELWISQMQRQREAVSPDTHEKTVVSHQEIFEATRSGSVDKAETLARQHLAGWQETMPLRGKGEAVAELTPLIAELGDEIERQHYIQQLSRMVQVDEMTISSRVQASARTQRAGMEARRRNAATASATSPDAGARAGCSTPARHKAGTRPAAPAPPPPHAPGTSARSGAPRPLPPAVPARSTPR